MKRVKLLMIIAVSAGLLSGCMRKFAPEETAVRIEKNGTITAAIIDKLDQSYYSEEELEETVTQAVEKYNTSVGEDKISIEKFESEERNISLLMEYLTSEDYEAFNNVGFYAGDIVGAQKAGHKFDIPFKKVVKGKVSDGDTDKKEAAGENYNIVIMEESMGVEVPGNIVFVSSNVEVTGKRKARVGVSQSVPEGETDAGTAQTEAESVQKTKESQTSVAYIIYE